jgi:hypothetical protein
VLARRKASVGPDALERGLRRLPAQARGQLTFERLLATAANLSRPKAEA